MAKKKPPAIASELAPPPPKPQPSQTEEIDRALVQAALRKRQAGQVPTSAERAALKRFEQAREEDQRWVYYRSIPQKHWRQMSGRQAKVLAEQAALYDLPFDGAIIDLPALVRKLHDFLALHHRKFKARDLDDMMDGGSSPALEQYRTERAKLARLDRLEREQQLLPRDQVHATHAQLASILRQAGETLQKKFGPDALEILNDALEDAQREISRMLGDAPTGGTAPPDA